ncbi:MAG: protein kinase domain-containing protein [Myxococcales bacterium]
MHEGLVLSERYQLVESLGSGGMGSVWRANDLRLGGEVAVKLMDPKLTDSQEALGRFRREAQAAAAIRSTYVVQIFDYGVDGDMPFIAMELLRGESLAARLKRVGQLKPPELGHILGHVGRALELAHSKGIVHRDLKPENIYLVREGDEDVGKMLDFGIARNVGAFSALEGLKTQTGTVLGTPFYMSAEQVSGQAVDHLTDIWSFGVIAWECLLGRRAFDGDSFGALYQGICVTELPVPSLYGPVPPGFDAWFARTVSRDRALRYQSIREATDDLRSLCGQYSEPPRVVTGSNNAAALGPERIEPADAISSLEQTAPPSANTIRQLVRRKPALAAMLGALVVLGVVAGVVLFGRQLSDKNRAAPSSAGISAAAPEAGVPFARASGPAVPSVVVVPQVVPVLTAPPSSAAPVVETSTPRAAEVTSPSAALPAAGKKPQPPPAKGQQATPSPKGQQATTRPRRNVSGI